MESIERGTPERHIRMVSSAMSYFRRGHIMAEQDMGSAVSSRALIVVAAIECWDVLTPERANLN